jgi:hypothetical protein
VEGHVVLPPIRRVLKRPVVTVEQQDRRGVPCENKELVFHVLTFQEEDCENQPGCNVVKHPSPRVRSVTPKIHAEKA